MAQLDPIPEGQGYRVTRRVAVPFAGEGSGQGPLTWGQVTIWLTIQKQRCSLGVGEAAPLPPGMSLEALIAGFSFLIGRHQSLRTRVGFDADGNAVQVVSERGEVPLEIVDVDDEGDPAAVGTALRARYHDTEFEYATEWPVRLAVIRHRGALTHVLALYCHMATDGSGLDAMMTDLANLDFRTGLATGPVTAMQPLEQAAWQRGPSGRRQSRAALQHWEHALRSIPARRFAESNDHDEPRFRYVYFDSPATHLATQRIAARTGTGTSPVLLAAFNVALARVTGTNPVATQLIAGNRFRPGMADYVGTLSENGLVVVDLADVTFDEAARRAWRGSLSAYRNAYYDPFELEALKARIGEERGEQVDVDCLFNDRRTDAQRAVADQVPTPDQVRAALPLTTWRWAPQLERAGERFIFHVNDKPDTVDIWLCIDGQCLSRDDTEALLRGFEAAAVEAALDPDAVTGIESGSAIEHAPAAGRP
jgi:hypothetical protein